MYNFRNLKTYSRMLCMVIVVVLCFARCKNSGNAKGDHLPPKQMEKVLLDLALAEAYCSQLKDSLHREGTKNYDSLALYYRQILDHYKITEQQLAENLAWYKNNPTELDSVCTNAMPVMLRWQSLNTNR